MISKIDVKGAAVFAPIAAGAADRLPGLQADVVHHFPGRLRLRSASLKRDARAGEAARRQLAEIDGVTSVTANPCTGSLLLEYNPIAVAPDKLVDALTTQGHIAPAIERRADPEENWADKLASAVKDWLINELAERLALAVISALA